QALCPEFLVQVERDLAVRARPQSMAVPFEVALEALVVVELAVGHDAQLLVLAGNRLVTGRQVDDAEPRMSETDAAVRCDPAALRVGAAMEEAARGAQQRLLGDRFAIGEHRHDAAHRVPPLRIAVGQLRRAPAADLADEAPTRSPFAGSSTHTR